MQVTARADNHYKRTVVVSAQIGDGYELEIRRRIFVEPDVAAAEARIQDARKTCTKITTGILLL